MKQRIIRLIDLKGGLSGAGIIAFQIYLHFVGSRILAVAGEDDLIVRTF